MPNAVGQLNNNWQNILILGPASFQIMDAAWPWTMHKAAEAFLFVLLCTIQLGSVQYIASCNIGVQQ
jgi:hypothetical protein